jgi:hypothetical protein
MMVVQYHEQGRSHVSNVLPLQRTGIVASFVKLETGKFVK